MQPHVWEKIEYDDSKRALATAHNIEFIIDTVRRSLRIADLYTRLRSFRLEKWQPHNCAVAGLNHCMPHGEEASTYELEQNSAYIDDAWKAENSKIFRECTRVHDALIVWL